MFKSYPVNWTKLDPPGTPPKLFSMYKYEKIRIFHLLKTGFGHKSNSLQVFMVLQAAVIFFFI